MSEAEIGRLPKKDFLEARGGSTIQKYQFSSELLDRIWNCRETDNYHGAYELLEDWIVILLSALASISAWEHLSRPAAITIYCIAIFFIGGRQRALADILHQASHGTLMKNKQVGCIFGTVFSGYPVLQSLSGYRVSHVYQHHGFLGDPNIDPDYRQYRLWGICGPNLNRSSVLRHLIRTFAISSTVSYLRYLATYRIFPKGEDPRERACRIIFVTSIILVMVLTGEGLLLMGYWLVPLITTQVWIGSFLELVEHYPLIETQRVTDLHVSRNRQVGKVSSFLLGAQQYDGYHLVHHKFPFIPSWRLPEAHSILMSDELYASLNRATGWPAIISSILDTNPAATVEC
jgi:fatty acid desaturase